MTSFRLDDDVITIWRVPGGTPIFLIYLGRFVSIDDREERILFTRKNAGYYYRDTALKYLRRKEMIWESVSPV